MAEELGLKDTQAEPEPEPDQPDEAWHEETLRKDLVILPPRQKSRGAFDALSLPPLRLEEPVQSLRAALTEVVGYAHLTQFRLELETHVETNGNKTSETLSVISPYTGKDAVITIPAQFKSTGDAVVLDEYGDLTGLVDLKDGMGFRIVLERYDAATIKDHVNRLCSLLDGNAPTVTSLVEDISKEDTNEEKQQEEKDARKRKTLPELKPLVTTSDVVVDGTNLKDFFYLAFGEDVNELHNGSTKPKKKKKGKNGKGEINAATSAEDGDDENLKDKIPRWNQLEELARVKCTIQHSGYHPPPSMRRMMGDLAYLNITLPDGTTLSVTATTLGFYVNRSTLSAFDPSPATEPHFSHALLDCILSASSSFREAWTTALSACKERAELTTLLNRKSPFSSLFRAAIRGDFDGFTSAATASQVTGEALDASLSTPSWLAPFPLKFTGTEQAWKRNQFHAYSPHRADEVLAKTFGVEIRSGSVRDWNEELQLAREMPTNTLQERLERARLIHKVMTEFGEASLLGVKAITEGQIAPMNPNEATRSQVYLHNNIFFSRGVDAGPETFKIAKGDKAARKSTNRDVQCIGTFHRMEKSGLYTLAHVLIDFLGTRFVCQSILPGILIGEKSHTLLYGSVETGIPLKWDEELHRILEDKVGEGMMIATRPVLRNPLTPVRMEEIKHQKKAMPLIAENEKKMEESQEGVDPNAVINTCVPVEAKGILGSDQRKYVLDLSRLTPRDANWVPREQGGTGKFEEADSKQNGKSAEPIPATLEDDEWTMSVLRPELVSRFTQLRMARHMQAQTKKKDDEETAANYGAETAEKNVSTVAMSDKREMTNEKEDEKEPGPETSSLSDEDLAYLQTLKLNLNVFLPHMRSFEGIDEEAALQVKADEQLAREVAEYLWDDVLPKITQAIREGAVHQVPVDGKTLTEFLHRNGVNCRYLGRLATLAKDQEEKDAAVDADLKHGKLTVIERKSMPRCWLEVTECEMVARAAKHVLDDYLTANGGVAASQPAQTIASFLSALVSEAEETAAQTETRMEKRSSQQPDDDEVAALTITDVGGDGGAVPPPIKSRYEVWQDIELEIGRRFRYSLTLYNRGNKLNRALYIPLLRRVCQRTGVRLLAKKYNLGGRCLCGGSNTFGGRLAPSYPVSPLDIADIVPLMKHAAAYSEGFTPCTFGATIGLPPLQVSMQDARATLERAHIQADGRALGKGLELAQEAGALYQRVTDSAAHPGVIESIELMATIFLEAGDPVNASVNGAKALGLTIQSSGFDSAAAFNAHMSLFQMLFTAHEMERAIKHLRAAIYLLEIMGGPRHIEHYTAYHKLGSVYLHPDYNGKYLTTALEYFREAKNRDSCDRLMDGFMAKNFAKVLTGLENYKDALEYEKKAFSTFSMFLGKDHQVTHESDAALQTLTKLAVDKGNRKEANDKMREEAAKADSIAADLAAEEEKKKKKNSKKKKKGKK
jgi:protein TIF31